MSPFEQMQQYDSSWGNLQYKDAPFMNKIKDHQLMNETVVNGNWGHGPNNNLGFYGFAGTPKQNAKLGKILGGSNGRNVRKNVNG